MTREGLSNVVDAAQDWDPEGLAALVRAVQDDVYHLSMRMLVNPQDAEDATQDILVLVIKKIASYEGRSSFTTWLYRVAMNYLLTSKKVRSRELGLSFSQFGQDLEDGLADEASAPAEEVAMLNELRIACTMAMLLCLDLKHRAAYLLGFVFELSHHDAADILEISRDNFRQRLSRAKKEIESFTTRSCGLANARAPCSCPRRLPVAIAKRRIGEQPFFSAGDAPDYAAVREEAQSLIRELRTAKLQRATRSFKSPRDFGDTLLELLKRTNKEKP